MCLYFSQILKYKPKEPSLWFEKQSTMLYNIFQ